VKVVVVGAGKMGLPLACQIADQGASVTACDVNAVAVARINAGVCPIDEPGMPELLARVVAKGALVASTETAAAAAGADVVIVIVPALLTADLDVDTSILESVAATLATAIRPGTLVSFETTMPVGGTRARLLPALEGGGLVAGEDFDLVFSPERVKSQSVLRNLTVNPKVVGGITPAAAARGEEFYTSFLGAPVQNVGTLEAAEMVKLAGMVYRDVSIALANELARYAEAVGVDLPSLIDAVNTDGEAALLQPGIGVGGHCTPVYPHFLIRDAERRGLSVPIADRSRRTNDGQAEHAVGRLEAAVGDLDGRAVTILGLAFRPRVKEHVCSTAFLLQEALARRGATVRLCDPLYGAAEIEAHGFVPATLDDLDEVLVVNTAHDEFVALDPVALAARGVTAVLDGRNCLDGAAVRAAGLAYVGIGRGTPEPSVARSLPIAAPYLGHDEAEAAAEVVRSGWVMQGPQVAAFEEEFAAYTGAAQACAVSSGTAALHLALLALGVGPGDEVITVSHSFIATANAVRMCGAKPIFVDIDLATYDVDPSEVERAVTRQTRAIIAVHQYGLPCDLTAVLDIARRHDLRVVEDAACAAGSEVLVDGRWERIGRPHADVATFSFHPRKVITTGEGGMVVTASPEIDRRVRLLRQHGTLDSACYTEVGFNLRMTDLQAAVGRRQLARLSALVLERRRLSDTYAELLAEVRGLCLPVEPAGVRSNWQTYCVLLDEGTDQALVAKRMAEAGVSTRPGIPSAHRQPAYTDVPTRHPLHRTEAAEERGLCLPLFPGMTRADQEQVVEALGRALGSGSTEGDQR
jgi:perosamine synthetase